VRHGTGFLLALVLGLMFAGLTLGACTLAPTGRTDSPTRSSASISQDATLQAQAALEQFFEAWDAGDLRRYNSLVATDKVATALDVDQVVVDTITPLSWTEDSLPGFGSPGATGVQAPEFRVFSAPVRLRGSASVEPGEQLDWTWYVIRSSDGTWRVFDWGAG
jgi:hypothetical protein